mmetsp:Transcript_48482/g.89325  ORF Transcript_48482/g.89325 Transcript_48482/m.89325 type:complete len:84 (-) Transcript_48482:109-360(-)
MEVEPQQDGTSCVQAQTLVEQVVTEDTTKEQEVEQPEKLEEEEHDDGDDSSDSESDSDDDLPMTRMNANGHLGQQRYAEDPYE